jgi:hypothetical protein
MMNIFLPRLILILLVGFVSASVRAQVVEAQLEKPEGKEKPIESKAFMSFKGFIGGFSNPSNVGNVPGNRSAYDLNLRFSLSEEYSPQRQEEILVLANTIFGDVRKNADIEVFSRLLANPLEQYSQSRESPLFLGFESQLNALVNDQGALMFSVNEFYMSLTWDRSWVKVGRSQLQWSDLDANWGLGKVNNRQNFNFFDPGQEGLFGVVLENKYSNGLKYQFFFSPLYIPELNPGLDIDSKSGTITSKNPWAKVPARSARIESRDVPIFYNVDYPSVDEVARRTSGGLSFGYEDTHWEAKSFFVRKPENQLSADVTYSYNSGDDRVNVDISPQFYYHDVLGAQLAWRNRGIRIYGSWLSIRPEEFPDGDPITTLYTQIEVEKRREEYFSLALERVKDKYAVGLGYIARLSPFNREDDFLAEDPRWNQALHAWFRYQFTDEVGFSSDLKYDTLTTDRLWMTNVNYLAAQSWLVYAGLHVIGAPDDGNSYWSDFKNNDAAFAGMRYLF